MTPKEEMIEWFLGVVAGGPAITDKMKQDMIDAYPNSTRFMNRFLQEVVEEESTVRADLREHLRKYLGGVITEEEAPDLVTLIRHPLAIRLNEIATLAAAQCGPHATYLTGRASDIACRILGERGAPEL